MIRQIFWRLFKRRSSLAVSALVALALQGGCTTGRDFRDAALPSLKTGINSILDGLVEGIFAAIEPEPQTE